jgi:hypothetical protein
MNIDIVCIDCTMYKVYKTNCTPSYVGRIIQCLNYVDDTIEWVLETHRTCPSLNVDDLKAIHGKLVSLDASRKV